ncbi:hypothetical protein DLE60_22260 [Micromonospora globispora]|uniref:hypothetical protein n=1 Tax=Micromonospora globispora TaxID=1450148 RepID=UPI000D6F0292|nr:hypothetical protein [Micromonospora globispora]PWU58340.1 hypothetical protein DLE60_22260 [Micromonospora globispora]
MGTAQNRAPFEAFVARRWVALACGLIAVGATLGMTGTATRASPASRAALTYEAVDQIPAYVVEAPEWTADVRDAPLERALVAFDINTHDVTFGPLTLVGPHDSYRIFDPSQSGGTWAGPVELSPDGRYLMTGHGQQTQLLDVTTGRTRMLRAGAPLAWSPDGRQAVLAHFDGDKDAYPVSGQIRIVAIPSGEVLWSIPLEPGPLPRSVDAVLSPDGSTVLVQRHGDLYAYRRGSGVVWHRSKSIDSLPGQLAWNPDGRSVAFDNTGLCLVAADTGKTNRCLNWRFPLSQLTDAVQTFGSPEIVAWEGQTPTISVGNAVVRVSATPEVLLRTPRDTRHVKIASSRVRWIPRQPGLPDPGPAIHRYRPIINIGGLAIVGVGVVNVAIRLRRRYARRPTR